MQKQVHQNLYVPLFALLSEIKILLRGAVSKEFWVSRILRRYPKSFGAHAN